MGSAVQRLAQFCGPVRFTTPCLKISTAVILRDLLASRKPTWIDPYYRNHCLQKYLS
ncbi:hypothetical protein B0H34DRAFT_737642 [Crassisporium funariophilum]|nr:hypothetical protein B0H34DRAFT_737642 [Crassisporium funariophilum]